MRAFLLLACLVSSLGQLGLAQKKTGVRGDPLAIAEAEAMVETMETQPAIFC